MYMSMIFVDSDRKNYLKFSKNNFIIWTKLLV